MRKPTYAVSTLISSLLMFASPLAYAQELAEADQNDATAARKLDTVIVTAERREAALQDVPIAVQAFDEDALETAGVTDTMSLPMLLPSLIMTDSTAFVIPYIRGAGSSVIGNGIYSSVATYVDGVYIARQTSGAFDLDNVQSVQVLSGPQGALYGRNATAGAIVVTTKAPSPDEPLEGRVSGSYGNYDRIDASARISGPISDALAFSLNGSINQRDGFIENLNPSGFGQHQDDLDSVDSFSVGGALTFRPNDDLSVVLRASRFESDDRGSCCYQPVGLEVFPGLIPGLNSNETAIAALATALLGTPVVGVNATFGNTLGQTYDPLSNARDNGTFNIDLPGGTGYFIRQDLASLTVDYDFGVFSGKSITSFGESEFNGSTSIFGEGPGLTVTTLLGATIPLSGSAGFTGAFPSSTKSQEFVLNSSESSPFVWTAGVYYFDEDGKTDLTGDFFGASLWSARNNYEVTSLAGYGQVTVPLSQTLSATGGLRYTTEEFRIDDRFDPSDLFSFPGIPNVGNLSQEDEQLTYLARLQYDNGPLLVYGGVSTGFKSGALNANNPIAGGAGPEKITSYEVGLKSDLLDNLRLNAAAFYYDYTNIQQNVIDSGSGATFLVNGGDAEIQGIDLELTYRPIEQFTLHASGTFLDSEVKTDAALASGSILPTKGKRTPGSPETSINVGGDWAIPFVTTGELTLNGNYIYNSGYFFDAENRIGTAGAEEGSFSLVNLNLSYTFPNENIRLSVWGNNVFDEAYYRTGVVAAGFALINIAAPPAQYGATLTIDF